MGIHPKIGVTGLPRSGKSAVMQKVVSMLAEERRDEMRARGDDVAAAKLLGGMRCEPVSENGERVGFKCVNFQTGEEKVFKYSAIEIRSL